MSRLGYEKPSAPKVFVTAVDEALREIVSSETSPDVLGRFLLAYRHRRNFPWLPESGQNPEAGMQDGLVCALRYALAEYIPGRSQYAEYATGDFPVSEDEQGRVKEAASAVVDDQLSLLQFSNGLSVGGA
ncbi:hypothetical protein ACFV2Q_35020 [Streptomyces sp. NPDC059650]|uniref:hypothetical protein n=1 Tax=Streptomyces sp. NPDC059650 TaxID=3346896 RepID=UPI0036BD5D1C